jgi:hypothetical protein
MYSRKVFISFLSACAALMSYSSKAGSLDDLVTSRGKGEIAVPISSVSVQPWFGVGKQNWTAAFSKLTDFLIRRTKEGKFELVESSGLSTIMLAVIEKNNRELEKLKDEAKTDTPPELKKLRDRIAEIKTQISTETEPVKRAKLKRELGDANKELAVLEAKTKKPEDLKGKAERELLGIISDKIKGYTVAPGLLASQSKPALSDLSFVSTWQNVIVPAGECVVIPGYDEKRNILDSLSLSAQTNVFDVSRAWLIGPLLNNASPLRLDASVADPIKSLVGEKLYRVSAIIVAREVAATGALPASFYDEVSASKLPEKAIYAGCLSLFSANGIGFDSPIAIPLAGTTGARNVVPQIIGFAVTPIPPISLE